MVQSFEIKDDPHGVKYINKYGTENQPEAGVTCENTNHAGRILKSTKSRKTGDIIFEEPPLHVVPEQRGHAVWMLLDKLNEEKSLVYETIWYWFALCSLTDADIAGQEETFLGMGTISPEQQHRLLLLFKPDQPCSDAISRICEALHLNCEPDKLEGLLEVWVHNCFEHSDSPRAYAVFFYSSFMSHSCKPNAMWHFQDNNFVLRARRDMQDGDEICITYLSEDDLMQSVMVRRDSLESTKHFVCMCPRCDVLSDNTRGMRCPSCQEGVIFMPTNPQEKGQSDADWVACATSSCKCKLSHADITHLWRKESDAQNRINKFEGRLDREAFKDIATDNFMAWSVNVFKTMQYHWLSDKLANVLATQLSAQKKYPQAIDLLEHRIKYLKHAYDSLNGALAWCMEELADLYAHENTDEAKKHYVASLEVLKLLFGESHEYYTEPKLKYDVLVESTA